MASFAIPVTSATGTISFGLVASAIKAWSDWDLLQQEHAIGRNWRDTPVWASSAGNGNLLARQGQGVAETPSVAERIGRQRAGGVRNVKDEVVQKEPSFLSKVRTRERDGRASFKTSNKLNPFSVGTSLGDILSKVPDRGAGPQSWARPEPRRPAGFDNRSFPQ
eukprot:jgi/Galph1/2197/GphlegSOOS_G888.1